MSEDTLDDPMDALDAADEEARDDEGEGGDGPSSDGDGDGDPEDAADATEASAEAAAGDEGADDEGEEVPDDRVAALEEELAERDERIEELEGRLKRVQADFENYKKRAERKREEFAQYATVDLISELLGVRDDLERAIDTDGEVREGVELVVEELDTILEDEGVERVATEGTTDPEEHEVMMQVDSDEHEEGAIVDVYEPGYRMGDRVIRPARVTVASGETSEDGDGEDAEASGGDTAADEGEGDGDGTDV